MITLTGKKEGFVIVVYFTSVTFLAEQPKVIVKIARQMIFLN